MSLKESLNTSPHPDQRSREDLIREAEAEILSPRQAFDIVIPGEIRANPHLNQKHQWLYGLIRNLCRREGYCWATDEYLSLETGDSIPTVQRYIRHLEASGVISRQAIMHGMKKRRRIFLTTEFKKVIITSPVNTPYHHQRSDGMITSDGYTEESITKERSSCSVSVTRETHEGETPPQEKPVGGFTKKRSDGTEILFDESEIFRHSIRHHPDWKTHEIEYALAAARACPGPINSVDGFLSGTIEKYRNKNNKPNINKERKCKTYRKTNEMTISPKEEQKSLRALLPQPMDPAMLKLLFPNL